MKEFLLRITNAVRLLGGNQEILDILQDSDTGLEEKAFLLKNWNVTQIDRVKTRICNLTNILNDQPTITVALE